MRKYLIASHGNLSIGMQHTLSLFLGEDKRISVVNAYVDENDYVDRIREFINSIGENDEAVIFTDILGGSVNQKTIELLMGKKNIHLITNMNLAVIISVLVNDAPINKEGLKGIVEESKVILVEFDSDIEKIDENDFLDWHQLIRRGGEYDWIY